jgi:hypothetical protein
MNEIEHEGKTYILKSQMESIIKERVGKVAQRATIAEDALSQAESRLEKAEKAMSSVDILNQQLTDMQTKLSTAEKRFERYQSISKHGLTDPDLIEAIEWSYERAQKGATDKDRLSLSDWLDSQVENPDKAPLTIRPHLRALKEVSSTAEDAPVSEDPSTVAQLAELERATPPRTNSGAIPAPDSPGFLDRALKDPDFYAANRDKVVEAWRHRQRRQS